MKKLTKHLSLLLCTTMLFALSDTTAFATQSRYENFDISSVTITSDAGKNMADVALSQMGKTGRDLGYSEEWCADFVGDCAILTGQSDAVPLYGAVEGLYTRLLERNATAVTDNPKPGDLVFINWNKEERKAHIEIVYSFDEATKTVHTVGGNTGSFSSYYERRVSTHKLSLDSKMIKAILRPDYNTCTEHSYVLFTCQNCGATHAGITELINRLMAFIYNIRNLFNSFVNI